MSYFDTSADRRLKELDTQLTTADIGVTVQAFDGDLSAIAALTFTGILVRTGSETWDLRTITAGSSAISITNPGGVAGNIVLDVVASGVDHGGLSGLADNDHPQYLLVADIDDTPVNGEVAQPISSNWAFDHVAAADPHTGYRLESADHNHQSSGAQAGQLDHGLALTGLTDDDHTQYALLAGRAGGQSFTGGTGAGDDLSLLSTSNATKGNIHFGTASTYDQVNDRWGMGTTSPQSRLDIRGVDQMLEVSGNASGVAAGIAINSRGSGNRYAYLDLVGDDTYTDWGIRLIRHNTGPNATSFLYHRGTGSLNFETLEAADIGFRTTATERMRISSSGDVAIAGNGTIAAPTVSHEVQGTDACLLAKGTTAERPTGVNGYIRHNTDINSPEFYNEAWTQFVGVLDRAVTQNDVVNTAAETSFYSFSVPANVLDTQKMLRLTLYGDYLNNSGAGQTLTIQVKFGGTTYYNDVSGTLAVSASRHPFRWEVLLGNRNATNVQSIGGYFSMGIAGGATTGLGDLATFATNTTGFETPFYNDGAIDTTAARTLEVTVQHSTNNASLSIRRQMAILEIL